MRFRTPFLWVTYLNAAMIFGLPSGLHNSRDSELYENTEGYEVFKENRSV